MTTGQLELSFAMVRRLQLVTPAMSAKTVRLGISTLPIIKILVVVVPQVFFIKVVSCLARLTVISAASSFISCRSELGRLARAFSPVQQSHWKRISSQKRRL